MREEFVPKVEVESRIGCAETGDEVIFESADSALGGVATVIAGGGELVFYLLAVHVGLKHGGSFVVEPLEFGLEPAGFEEKLGSGVGSGVLFLDAVLHELGVDEVGVVVVEDEEILAAADGWDNKAARLVGVDLAGGRKAFGVQVFGFEGRRAGVGHGRFGGEERGAGRVDGGRSGRRDG